MKSIDVDMFHSKYLCLHFVVNKQRYLDRFVSRYYILYRKTADGAGRELLITFIFHTQSTSF